MAKTKSSRPGRFTDELLNEATEILRPHAPPEALPVLPELLRVWEKEGLPECLSLPAPAVYKRRTEQLDGFRQIAVDLIASFLALDDNGLFQIACRPELHARGLKLVDGRWDLAVAFGPSDIIHAGERKRDDALSWLRDVVAGFQTHEPKPANTSARAYLITLDMGSIYHLITRTAPTRKIDFSSGRPYGPFFEFLKCLSRAVPELGSVDDAIRNMVPLYLLAPPQPSRGKRRTRQSSPTEFSAFVLSLEFRHSALWEKLKQLSPNISHF
jgi:hypothetical protein